MAKTHPAHHQPAATPITPPSTAQTVNTNVVTTNSTTPHGSAENLSQGPMQEVQPPRDLELVREWAVTLNPKPSAERQKRIMEGMRQTAALTRTRDDVQNSGNGGGYDGQARCPATGGYCGEKGYGPCGIHSACAPLDISTYYE